MILDFHNHFYPPEFIAAVRTGPSNFQVTDDDEGNPVLHSPGDYNVAVPGHRDIEYRTQVLDQAGVDMQVITFTAPGTYLEASDRAPYLAALVNDALAKIKEERSDRFTSLAHLPLTNPEASAKEARRALEELRFPGFMPFGNVNGVPLADERFWPVYEIANDHEAVIYIHPTYPLGVEAMTEYMLMPMVGFLFDTTLAAAHLVLAGVPERFPRIKWVLAHLGGTIPFLMERLDRCFHAYEVSRKHISVPPSEYLKKFYYDTVNFDVDALRFTIDLVGVDRILAGSDYPHLIGSLEKMKASIQALGLSQEDEAKVFGGNAERILGFR
ncbi:MAG: amidohydrolase family protein [Gemmatimonadota bacterium]|jgi:aminocarboxymuconate-semialdehyde decarboxylase